MIKLAFVIVATISGSGGAHILVGEGDRWEYLCILGLPPLCREKDNVTR